MRSEEERINRFYEILQYVQKFCINDTGIVLTDLKKVVLYKKGIDLILPIMDYPPPLKTVYQLKITVCFFTLSENVSFRIASLFV